MPFHLHKVTYSHQTYTYTHTQTYTSARSYHAFVCRILFLPFNQFILFISLLASGAFTFLLIFGMLANMAQKQQRRQ